MKALVKKFSQPGLWLEDVPEPKIGINDVLIRVDRTGICGTDMHIYHWDRWAQKTIPVPMVVGHEFVGRIVEVGSNVSDFRSGDLVSGEGHVVCGRCRNCLAGRRHLCAHTAGIGVNRPGAFAEYIALPMTNVWQHHRRSIWILPQFLTPLEMPSIPLCRFPSWVKMYSSRAPDLLVAWPQPSLNTLEHDSWL